MVVLVKGSKEDYKSVKLKQQRVFTVCSHVLGAEAPAWLPRLTGHAGVQGCQALTAA